ncbi:MAG: hypothetical protein ACE5GW_07300 [Planctomycetota bacterium]
MSTEGFDPDTFAVIVFAAVTLGVVALTWDRRVPQAPPPAATPPAAPGALQEEARARARG